ncbi:MAG: hypothetical protein HQ517_05320 [SAR324 cluster bacterium]|nr:hypothetical protein [SAR324 cluster bacterium]
MNNQKRLKYFLIAMIVLLYPVALSANKLVVLENGTDIYSIGPFLEILEDKDGKWTIDQVTAGELPEKFLPNDRETPNFGYTSNVYWLRFKIKNQSTEEKRWLLEVGYPLIDHIALLGSF